MTKPIIRPAKIEDLKSIQDLNHGLFEQDQQWTTHLIMDWAYSEEGKAYFERGITGKDDTCFVAEIDREVVGYVRGVIVHGASYRSVRMAELANFFVLEGHRSQGIGAALVAAFTQWCKEAGAERMFVDASACNSRGIQFYKKNGFEPTAVILEKEL